MASKSISRLRSSTDKELVPSLHAGSQFGKFVFSLDSRYLFCACGSFIKVFNTTNGECLHDLIGHLSKVTGVAVNPSNALQVVSCGLEGYLIYWDYLDGVKLKQLDLHMQLYGIVQISKEKKSIMMVAQSSAEAEACLLQFKRDKEKPSEFTSPKVLIKNCNKDVNLVSFGCNNEYAASAEKNELFVYSMARQSIHSMIDSDIYNKTKSITCVACHPTEYCIATGLENGRILLWYNFYKKGQQSVACIHWHSLPALCLNFSPDGSILLSGGHECVFVRWQMNNTNQRDYKPRMGAPLNQVLCSPDGNFYASGHSDNVIQLMDINLKILQVYRGLTRANLGKQTGKNPIPVGLIYDPRSKAMVTNGLPGHLQFFSLSLQKQLFNLDIVGQNYISPENLEKPIVVTEVKQAAISSDGQWLATFEIWEDASFSSDLRLKFWQYSSGSQTYVLNTTVESPHDQEITSMSFRPPPPSGHGSNTLTLVTTGADQCFKLWTLVDDTDIYRENTRWDCDSVGFYRNLNTSCSDFSYDGSSLAVNFEHLLTLWDPDNNVVRKTLAPHLPQRELIRALKFGSNDSKYFLVVATENYLLSWNLLTLTVEWTIEVQGSGLIRDPGSDLMAVVSRSTSLHIFRPNSSERIYSHDTVSSSPILSAIFIPKARPDNVANVGWPSASQIYIYNLEDHLLTLDSPDRRETSKVKIAQNLPQQAIASLIAEKTTKQPDAIEKKDTLRKTRIRDDSFLSTMLHSNEPISMYAHDYVRRLLVKKKHSSEPDEEEESKSSESENESLAPELNESQDSQDPQDTKTAIAPKAVADQIEIGAALKSMPAMEWMKMLNFEGAWADN